MSITLIHVLFSDQFSKVNENSEYLRLYESIKLSINKTAKEIEARLEKKQFFKSC